MITIQELLKKTIELQASDLHLTADAPPLFRIDGALKPIIPETISSDLTQNLAYTIMNEEQKALYERVNEITFAFGVEDLGRFRANIFSQRGCTSCTLRQIPTTIKKIDELGLPKTTEKLASKSKGLVLVTGPTGSGKSTTLAAMIDQINSELEGHILTIENPIEFMHLHRNCIINQREVTHDTESYLTALQVVSGQDPDVVFVSDIPDAEIADEILNIAESGHLTLTAINANSTVATINKICNMFPCEERSSVLAQVASVLEGVINQALLPLIGGGGTLACEVMVVNSKIRSLIRDDKLEELPGAIEAGKDKGMQVLNENLAQLYSSKKITKKDALNASSDPEELAKQLT